MKNIKHKKLIISFSAVAAFFLLVAAVFFIYTAIYYRASDEAKQAVAVVGATYSVENLDGNIVFRPANPKLGLIFYPGGKVEYTAYAPLLAEMASNSVLCILVKMPFNLAVFDVSAANGLQEKFPEVESWYMGGHSLGGAMAASYVSSHLQSFDGLLLLGAYSTADISQSELNVISVYGSEDKVMNKTKYDANLSNLPHNITEYVVEGGCHSYFGNYGMQKGDGTPTVTRRQQISQTVQVFLFAVANRR